MIHAPIEEDQRKPGHIEGDRLWNGVEWVGIEAPDFPSSDVFPLPRVGEVKGGRMWNGNRWVPAYIGKE